MKKAVRFNLKLLTATLLFVAGIASAAPTLFWYGGPSVVNYLEFAGNSPTPVVIMSFDGGSHQFTYTMDSTRSNYAFAPNDNAKAVYSALLTSRTLGIPVRILVDNNQCADSPTPGAPCILTSNRLKFFGVAW